MCINASRKLGFSKITAVKSADRHGPEQDLLVVYYDNEISWWVYQRRSDFAIWSIRRKIQGLSSPVFSGIFPVK